MVRLWVLFSRSRTVTLGGLLWLLCATAAAAQDRCQAVVDLKRLFTTLTDHAAAGTLPSRGRAQTLLAMENRYDAPSLTYTFLPSAVGSQTTLLVDTYGTALEIAQAITLSPPDPSGLRDAAAVLQMNRALAVLGRLECPPAPPMTEDAGFTSRLPRTHAIDAAVQRLDTGSWVRNLLIAAAVLSVLSIGVLAFNVMRARARARAKRYLCEISVVYIDPAPVPILAGGHIVDVSRIGAKIGNLSCTAPPVGSLITLQIAQRQKRLKVRWRNAHFFGGTFARSFTRRDMLDLLRSDGNLLKQRRSAAAPRLPDLPTLRRRAAD